MNDKELEETLQGETLDPQSQNAGAVEGQEEVTEATEVAQQEQQAATPGANAAPVVTPTGTSKERNLRILRERAERLERENEELRRSTQPQFQQKSESDDEDFKLGVKEDELVEGKHLSGLSQEIRAIRRELKEAKAALNQSKNMTIETKLKAAHADFDKVVTKENMEVLAELDPEMYDVIQASPNLYAKAKTAYNQIKKYGIYTEESYDEDKEVVQRNSVKPRPTNAIAPQAGATPLSRANEFKRELTAEDQQRIYAETWRLAQGR